MKKQILFLALTMILSVKSFSQIIFESGYFINVSNQRIECLIKNIDWKSNPSKFEFMLLQDTIVQIGTIETVKEFGIIDVSKYIRSTVKMDRSSDEINKMSSERNPDFKEEHLFLKVLIEGSASLYLYENGSLKRFFYNLDDSEIKQLVYKRYLLDNQIVRNNYFKQQLFRDLKCQTIFLNNVENLKYTKGHLERFFIKYNECAGSNYINHISKKKKDMFNLSFRPGLNYSTFALKNSVLSRDVDFESKPNYRFGIEAEFILPFNKNKWSIIIEPTYQYFNSEKKNKVNNISGGSIVSRINYQSIELPIGIRHYFFFNDKSKIFVDISYLFDYSFDSFIEFTRIDGSLLGSIEVWSRRNLALGTGYKYNNKYSLVMRYQTGRDLVGDELAWNSWYKTFSVIFGYSLF